MTARSYSALILILDCDLGFMMWLGQVFAELGYQTIPALTCRQALVLVRRFDLPVATLVLNWELRGARRLVKILAAENPGLQIITIRDSAARRNGQQQAAPNCMWIVSSLERPAPGESISCGEWAVRVRKALAPPAGAPN